MMRDITIGQYYPADSILHRLDPRVKFVSTLVYIVSLFVFSSWLGYGVAALFLVAMIVLSKVPFGFMIKGLKPIMVLLLITMFFNLVFTPGEVLWSFWILKITKECIRSPSRWVIRSGISDHRCIDHDTDYHTEPVDRWSGTTASAAEQDSCAGS